jgi:hypothetical protein
MARDVERVCGASWPTRNDPPLVRQVAGGRDEFGVPNACCDRVAEHRCGGVGSRKASNRTTSLAPSPKLKMETSYRLGSPRKATGQSHVTTRKRLRERLDFVATCMAAPARRVCAEEQGTAGLSPYS